MIAVPTGRLALRTILRSLLMATLVAALAAAFGAWRPAPRVLASTETSPTLQDPDQVCAGCHQAIYDRYKQTSMARGSSTAMQGLIEGGFHHSPSGIDYRIFARNGSAWMSYSRSASSPQGELHGEEQLLYSIGSGHRGRTFLYSVGKQWFELPINYYTARHTWAMAPAYDNAAHLPAPLPVDPNCLHCHTSLTQTALPTARNRYAGQPFLQGGIGCSSCHGDPAAHLAQHGHGPIVNPAKLTPARRDSACIQCHLEGDAVVYRPGRSLAQFQAGDDLADFAVYFVRSSRATGGARATSQYEALLHSACKRATGDALTCTSCHDPHFDPPAAERVAYFRARCLACHNTPAMATHHSEQPSCAHCHMPTRSTVDISHEQVTDHDIERVPTTNADHPTGVDHETLTPVGSFAASDREFGLAYSQLAAHGFPGAADEAMRRLNAALAQGAHDEETEVRLAYLSQVAHSPAKAQSLYDAALQQDPYDPIALSNLAVLDATSGRGTEAVHLLDRLITYDPSQTVAGLNLAWIECSSGHPGEAREILLRLQRLNPDDPQLRDFLSHGTYSGGHCAIPLASTSPAATGKE